MLADVLLSLLLELDLVPVVVEGYDGVDRVAEFGHQQERVDGIDEIFGGRVDGPVAVKDRVADTTVAIDIGVVNRRDETSLWWRHGVVFAHLHVE